MDNIPGPPNEGYLASATPVFFLYLLFVITPILDNSKRLKIFVLVVTLSLSSRWLTTGSVLLDYSRGLLTFAIPMLFLDLLIFADPYCVEYTGRAQSTGVERIRISEGVCPTLWQKVKWSMRLVATYRSIGWSWRFKGVLNHTDQFLSRTDFAVKNLQLSGSLFMYNLLCQYLMQLVIAARAETITQGLRWTLDFLEGWLGALLAATGLSLVYRILATASLGVGICEPWEWPPLFGKLEDGWSVRQIWR